MRISRLIILSILTILFLNNRIYAEEDVNIHDWSFIKLTKASDQDENVVVSKFYYVPDRKQVAFCIEPNVKFDPSKEGYTKSLYDNENVYKIVKAYKKLNKSDKEYYIAAQLLIWKEVSDVDYTFNGLDYGEYKQEIIDAMNPNKPLLKSLNNTIPETYYGEEGLFNGDYSKYEASGEGIEILSNDENGIKYLVDEKEPEIKTINLVPKDSDEKHSYVMESEDSQDLYYFEGEYSDLKPMALSLRTLFKPETITINYSKKDENGNNISGAEFTVYELNSDEPNSEISFIQTNTNVNIYEALLDNYLNYSNLSIEISERYEKYLDKNIFNSNELGYFPYKIYSNEQLIKDGKCYVTDDIQQSNGAYSRIAAKAILSHFSEDLDVNSINNLDSSKSYYLCESEPKKGYTYTQKACNLIDSNNYTGETIEYINKTRTYSLRLMKQSDQNILLNGAKFKITYDNFGEDKNVILTTGCLSINRENNNKYLIYKHENSNNPIVIEFAGEEYVKSGLESGRYYYYQSDSSIVNNSLLNNDYQIVVNGGLEIEDLPYSSSLTIEELQAPKGFVITEPIYHISPDIAYSQITFKNYRVNFMDIIPKKFIIPKTCIDE